jgi:hypothetical protein
MIISIPDQTVDAIVQSSKNIANVVMLYVYVLDPVAAQAAMRRHAIEQQRMTKIILLSIII